MRYLVGIPCLYGFGHTRDAIESVIHKKDVDLLLIDNGAEHEVSQLIKGYKDNYPNVTVIKNEVNIFVNPAWNQIINVFLMYNHDYLLIMNSDLILHSKWRDVLDYYLTKYPNQIPVPYITTDSSQLNKSVQLNYDNDEVYNSTPGVCIVISKNHANKIYPIPQQIKVWFGDNWIYDNLRGMGYRTVVLPSFISYHSGSQNVSRLEGISEIIENDKIEWSKIITKP